MVDLSKLSPIIRAHLQEHEQEYIQFGKLSVEEKRIALSTMYTNTPLECPNYNITDRDIASKGLTVPVRFYQSKSPDPLPVIVYLHGGGWVLGDLEAQDPLCRRICNAVDVQVINVGYRLAPEYKFPAAMDDGYTVLNWIMENSEAFKFNTDRIILAGDSAGGNLSALLTVRFNEENTTKSIFHQVLIYPVTDLSRFDTESYNLFASGFGLSKDGMLWYAKQYLGDQDFAKDPKVSPIYETRYSLISPTTIIAAGFDVLRSEGEAFAKKLKENGVKVEYVLFENMIHSYLRMAELDPMAKQCIDKTVQIFVSLLS